ncbi:alpha/beta fold hydrolase [Nonomuraea sediminis]|uniref:alpha/beta fold hydrolase n=1 Tax=Nonomuraea sediminis TaxID=2835864 RepID=UPI001BDD0D88|nr:alpha/beta hydrolase [Nonomuraea sediminis]
MRGIPGQIVPVNGRSVYVEESGQGPDWVVFEAGMSCGRTCWDPLLPHLADRARLVTYDRAGRALTGTATRQRSIDDMAADLVAMVEAVVPGKFVLVAHSMGGLIARRAAESLEHRLQGLLLIDPTPVTAPMYDTWDRTAKQIDQNLAVAQLLTRVRPLARLASRNIRGLYSKDTYETMVREDFTPAGVAQMRNENRAVLAAVRPYRDQPPHPPKCPTVLLAATRPPASTPRGRRLAEGREHQRRYAESLPDGRYEDVDSAHFIQAEQPHLVADRTRQLLS